MFPKLVYFFCHGENVFLALSLVDFCFENQGLTLTTDPFHLN